MENDNETKGESVMKEYTCRMKKRLFNSKGITTIEIAISAMIIIIGLAGFLDMVNMSQKLDTTSSVTGYVGRVVAGQGGITETVNTSNNGYYVTTTQLYREVKETLAGGGISEEDFTLRINGVVIKPGVNINPPVIKEPNRPQTKEMNINLNVDYKWNFISGVLGTELKSKQSSKKTVISTFKIREGNFVDK